MLDRPQVKGCAGVTIRPLRHLLQRHHPEIPVRNATVQLFCSFIPLCGQYYVRHAPVQPLCCFSLLHGHFYVRHAPVQFFCCFYAKVQTFLCSTCADATFFSSRGADNFIFDMQQFNFFGVFPICRHFYARPAARQLFRCFPNVQTCLCSTCAGITFLLYSQRADMFVFDTRRYNTFRCFPNVQICLCSTRSSSIFALFSYCEDVFYV